MKMDLDLVEILDLVHLNDTLIVQQEQEALLRAERKLAEETGPISRSRRQRFVRDMARLA